MTRKAQKWTWGIVVLLVVSILIIGMPITSLAQETLVRENQTTHD